MLGLGYRSETIVRHKDKNSAGRLDDARQLLAEPMAADHMFENFGCDCHIKLRLLKRHIQQSSAGHRDPFGGQALYGIFGLLKSVQPCEASIAQISKNAAVAAA